MAVFQLNEELWFPNPYLGERNGFIAVGGDLSVPRLLLAYSNGFFPWFDFKRASMPRWYCPLDRYVIFPDHIHISHSMRQVMRSNRYHISFNKDFEGVIRGCAFADGRYYQQGAWLGDDIIKAYSELHRQGYARSVEVWSDENETHLVGGLYGVAICNAFFGESMFSIEPNSSKLALIHLANSMKNSGGYFIDCQFETPLFRSMGGEHITYNEYIRFLRQQKPE